MTTNGFFAKRRRQALLILGRDGIFGTGDEEDFLAWCTFAAGRIDVESGLRVIVHVRDADESCQLNRIVSADAPDEARAQSALQRLWGVWSRLSSGSIRLDAEALDGEADDDGFYDRPTPVRVVPAARRM